MPPVYVHVMIMIFIEFMKGAEHESLRTQNILRQRNRATGLRYISGSHRNTRHQLPPLVAMAGAGQISGCHQAGALLVLPKKGSRKTCQASIENSLFNQWRTPLPRTSTMLRTPMMH